MRHTGVATPNVFKSGGRGNVNLLNKQANHYLDQLANEAFTDNDSN